jgi:hypothetical protein
MNTVARADVLDKIDPEDESSLRDRGRAAPTSHGRCAKLTGAPVALRVGWSRETAATLFYLQRIRPTEQAMPADGNVWPLVGELSEALDGNRESSEETLDQLEAALHALPRDARDEIRRQMIQVVAALSRLEVRLIDSDGPIDTAI